MADVIPIFYNIFGISIEIVFLVVLIVFGIILIKNKNILKIDRRKIALFLILFILFSYMPILYVTFEGSFSLLEIIEKVIKSNADQLGFMDIGSLIIFLPLLLIISYLLSCLTIFTYSKFKNQK